MRDKTIQHDIVADVVRVAREIGKIPTRNEYLAHGRFSQYNVISQFSSYTMLLQAAGLEHTRGKKDRAEIKSEEYEKLKKEVEEKKLSASPPPIISSLLCISDQHEPYGHEDKTDFLFALDDKYKFQRILIGGDEGDGHGWSFHDHDPDLHSPGKELEEAVRRLEPLYKRWPNADVLESNHGSLLYRKGKHHGIPRHMLRDYNEVLKAPPGWKWQEEFYYQFSNGKKAIAHHGYSSNALLAAQKRGMSLIQFHFHSKFSIQYWQNKEELMWALQCGCLIDDTSLAMAYNKLTIERPIIGVGAVFDGFPRLFPMPMDSKGRWNGIVP